MPLAEAAHGCGDRLMDNLLLLSYYYIHIHIWVYGIDEMILWPPDAQHHRPESEARDREAINQLMNIPRT